VAEECERRGVEPEQLPSDFGMSPLVKEAERLGAELVDAADALSPPQSEWEEGLLATVVGGACLMATKTVRIARELGETVSPETAGVLLLLEHTRRSVDIALAQLPRRRKLRAGSERWRRSSGSSSGPCSPASPRRPAASCRRSS
jgi:hypothetical protein